MNTKAIAMIITFAALAIVLNTLRIPTFYWPGFYYRIYEIPIVVAFLLFGPRVGTAVAVLNLFGQIVFFPVPGGIVAYPFGLLAILTMMLGVYLGNMLNRSRFFQGKTLYRSKNVFFITAFGTIVRTAIMPLLDYSLLYHILLPLVLNRIFTEGYMIGLLPGMVVFNATVPLYTLPISYFIAKKVSTSLKIIGPQKKALNFSFENY
jgi:riboflavin transporter FmnP